MAVEQLETGIRFESKELPKPPAELEAFVKTLTETEDTTERREAQRHSLKAPIPAVPVSEDVEPVATPMVLYSRNISTSGISFIHTEPIGFTHLAVELTGARGEKIQLLVEVIRCAPLGDYFEVAGRHVRRLNAPEVAEG